MKVHNTFGTTKAALSLERILNEKNRKQPGRAINRTLTCLSNILHQLDIDNTLDVYTKKILILSLRDFFTNRVSNSNVITNDELTYTKNIIHTRCKVLLKKYC